MYRLQTLQIASAWAKEIAGIRIQTENNSILQSATHPQSPDAHAQIHPYETGA